MAVDISSDEADFRDEIREFLSTLALGAVRARLERTCTEARSIRAR